MTARLVCIASCLAVCLVAAPAVAQVTVKGENEPSLLTKPYEYTSQDGQFKVTWPSGCGQVVRRQSVPDPDVDPFDRVDVYTVYCDQNGQQGRGCAVTAIFNLKGKDGGMPGPQDVVSRMEEHMKELGVQVIKQAPLGRELPDGSKIEGLDILAAEPHGAGQAWLRGLLYDGTVYLLSAWNKQGGLWDDSEYVTFFNSFEPLVE